MKILDPIVFSALDFQRASVANYYDVDGLLAEAGVDQIRFGYNPTTLEFIGPIIEGEAKNCIIKSIDFTDAAWTGVGTAPTVNPVINPSGDFTTTFIKGGAFSTASREQELNGADFGSGVGCWSIYAKGLNPNSGGFYTVRLTIESDTTTTGVFSVDPDDFYALEAFSGIEKLPNDWFRIWLYGPVDPLATTAIRIAHTSSGDAQETYIWGAQFEMIDSGLPSSFIYTDATIETRAADIVIDQPGSRVLSSNVAEDDAIVWDSGFPYVAEDEVMVLGQYHKLYASVGSNTNKFPPDNVPAEWIDMGATNRWRMFDMGVGPDKQTTATDSSGDINVLIQLTQKINSVVLFNVNAASVNVVMRDDYGNIVYDETVEALSPPPESGWWSFFFGARRRAETIVFSGLPPYLSATLEVTAYGDGGDAAIGKLIIGNAIDIGCSKFGTSVGILDFSIKGRDAFGNSYVVPRRFVDDCEFPVQIDSYNVDNVKALLASVTAKPAVYLGSEKYKSTIVFGFYRSFRIVIEGPRKSMVAIQTEGI